MLPFSPVSQAIPVYSAITNISVPSVRHSSDLAFRAVTVYFVSSPNVAVTFRGYDSIDNPKKVTYKATTDNNGVCQFTVVPSALLFRIGLQQPTYDLSCSAMGINASVWVDIDGGTISGFNLPSDFSSRVQSDLNTHYNY